MPRRRRAAQSVTAKSGETAQEATERAGMVGVRLADYEVEPEERDKVMYAALASGQMNARELVAIEKREAEKRHADVVGPTREVRRWPLEMRRLWAFVMLRLDMGMVRLSDDALWEMIDSAIARRAQRDRIAARVGEARLEEVGHGEP